MFFGVFGVEGFRFQLTCFVRAYLGTFQGSSGVGALVAQVKGSQ